MWKFLSSVLGLLPYIGRALMGWWGRWGDWTGSLVALGSANRVEHEGSQPHAAGDTGKDQAQAEAGAATLSTATARPRARPVLCSEMPCDQASCKI